MASQRQDAVLRHSLEDAETFWMQQASQLEWHRPPSTALRRTRKQLLSGASHQHWEWFPDGEISTCFNCVDRHVLAGRGDEPALLYDSPVTGTRQRITYAQLLDEVEVLAGVLQHEQVCKGSVVLVYMPVIPAALIGLLAINRLGAVHAVVFGGFAPAALAQRIDACRPVVVLTASCGIDRVKAPMAYRPRVEEALRLARWKPARTLVWQRKESPWHPLDDANGQRDWQQLVGSYRMRTRRRPACVPVSSTHPVYVIYTSGTTGLPKGVVREAGGHAVGLLLSTRYLFDIHGPGDVMGCFSDIGWVVGHSFTLYGPLLTGAATVLYEGKPVGTPDASAFWRLVAEYKVTTMFTAPTALRAIRRDDVQNEHMARIGQEDGLRSLRGLFLAGERSEPALVARYQDLLTRYAADGARVVDNWWSSESGSPISGIALAPRVALVPQTTTLSHDNEQIPSVRPGSAGKAMPGFDVRVVNDDGIEVARGCMGNVVLAMPLAPTAFRALWRDEERFYASYLRRFNGRWFDTGDAGCVDQEGYIYIMARSDDIINVAAHRLSTGALEQAITSHPLVAEATVVGMPDALKGQLPFAFVITGDETVATDKLFAEVQQLVRTQVGSIATLGGMIRGDAMIPKTRSGKTLRRVLRELVENAVHGDVDKPIDVPSTVDNAAAVEVAREYVRRYFQENRQRHGAIEARAKI